MSAQSPIDFADPDAVRGLVPGSDQRLVRLSFPDGTTLYSHPVPLALTSGVLRNVLEDTQAQQQKEGAEKYTTIPLDDGADAAASCKTALAFMHNQQADEVTMDNAQGLLLLGDKYEMPCITVRVLEYLVNTPEHKHSRLAQHLTQQTVVTAASKCGLQQAVKLCIDFIVEQQMPVDFGALSGLNRADADQLLFAMHKRCAGYRQKVDACNNWLAGRGFKDTTVATYECGKCHTWAVVHKSPDYYAQCPKCTAPGSLQASLQLAQLQRILQP